MPAAPRSLLRFITCGSVDDGKSTLIGRLLADTGAVPADQLAALRADSARVGTQGSAIDYALLVDGLAAEREQGITIDVAYRFFASATRRFIVADTPGHVQYTRNMVTGASTADLAVILVDATQGVLEQTRRHSFLVHLLGVRQVVLAVNKMDRVGWDEATFARVTDDYAAFAATLGLAFTAIPVCALTGDNFLVLSSASRWYTGPTLLGALDAAPGADDRAAAPLRLAVQWVNRPNADFRGYAGLLSAGTIAPGDRLQVLPSGREARVARVMLGEGDLEQAVAGQSVTITLDRPVDVRVSVRRRDGETEPGGTRRNRRRPDRADVDPLGSKRLGRPDCDRGVAQDPRNDVAEAARLNPDMGQPLAEPPSARQGALAPFGLV